MIDVDSIVARALERHASEVERAIQPHAEHLDWADVQVFANPADGFLAKTLVLCFLCGTYQAVVVVVPSATLARSA